MSKGSGKRKQDVTDEELEENWNRIFKGNVAREEDENGDKYKTKKSEETKR